MQQSQGSPVGDLPRPLEPEESPVVHRFRLYRQRFTEPSHQGINFSGRETCRSSTAPFHAVPSPATCFPMQAGSMLLSLGSSAPPPPSRVLCVSQERTLGLPLGLIRPGRWRRVPLPEPAPPTQLSAAATTKLHNLAVCINGMGSAIFQPFGAPLQLYNLPSPCHAHPWYGEPCTH